VWAATNYMKEHLTVVEYEPAERTAFVSVGWPGFVGAATAMSQHGMTVGSTTVPTLRNLIFGTPATLLYRGIMEHASSLEQAIGMLRRARRTQGNNVLLGSGREGRAAVVEYTPWRFAVRPVEDGWIAATNHFVHPHMTKHHANLAWRSSIERLARLNELSLGRDSSSAEDLAGFLVDVQRRTADADEYCTVCNPCTVYSVLFEPCRGSAWVRASDRVERTFQRIDLGATPACASGVGA